MMERSWAKAVGAALLIATSVGCGDGAEGDWQSRDAVGGQRNAMRLNDAGVGEARLWILRTVDGQQAVSNFLFDARWDPQAEGVLSVEMVCVHSPFDECGEGDDFTMACTLGDSALACSGSDNWRDYVFDWERRPD